MPNSYFQFRQFIIHQDQSAMKVTTDACLFGAWAAKNIAGRKEIKKILDIGTGTGLLSLMLAQKNSTALIDAIEIDEAAARQAMENVAHSPWQNNIKVKHADIKKPDTIVSTGYDIILSNPPFYEKEIRASERRANLARHDQGLLLPDLLSIIKKNLHPDGRFYLLLPYKRRQQVKRLLADNDFDTEQLILVKQSVNHDYFRLMICGKINTRQTGEKAIEEIAIKDENDKYTLPFIALLKDYYLYL